MDTIRLISPDHDHAKDIWAFRSEILENDADSEDQFAGCMSLDTCSSVEEWIRICELRSNKATCGEVGSQVPSDTYLAVRQSDDRIGGNLQGIPAEREGQCQQNAACDPAFQCVIPPEK